MELIKYVSCFLLLAFHNNTSCQQIAPIRLISCDKQDLQDINSCYKKINELINYNATTCKVKGSKGQCNEGIIVTKNYIYVGAYSQNSEDDRKLGLDSKAEFDGAIIWRNGAFFVGKFKNRQPANGYLILDRDSYYKGYTNKNFENYKAQEPNFEDIVPAGSGKKYINKCNGALINQGNFVNGECSDENRIGENQIHIFDQTTCEEKKAVIVFLDEQIEQKNRELKQIRSEISNLEKTIQSKTIELATINKKILEAKLQLSLIQQDPKNKEVEAVKNTFIEPYNNRSLKELLSQVNYQPNPDEFQILYNTAHKKDSGQDYINYIEKLKKHLLTTKLDNYKLTEYFIRVMSAKSVFDSWEVNFKTPFNNNLLKDDIVCLVVASFVNPQTLETYNVYFYKMPSGKHKIIQFQILNK